MALTAKAVLHHRQREDGTFRVRVRLTKNRAVCFLDAGFTLLKKHWNADATAAVNAAWVRRAETEWEAHNEEILRLLGQARATDRAHPELSAEQIRDLLRVALGRPAPAAVPARPDGAPTDLSGFAAWYVQQRARVDKPNTVKFYADAARAVRQWCGDAPLPLSRLTAFDLREFHTWLLEQPTIFAGTARDRLVKLGTIVRRAEKMGLLPAGKNPFAELDLPRVGNKNPPRRPTEEQQRAVLALDLDALDFDFHIHNNFRADLVVRRDIWHLQYLVRGSRCGDMLQLRERDVRPEQISFTETKTGKAKGTGRTAAINAILARYQPTGDPLAYVFPGLDAAAPYAVPHPSQAQLELLSAALRSRVQWVNDGLRHLAHLAGVPAFSSHSARHLFLERAYVKTKDMRLVQKMANHTAIGTTEAYISTLGYSALDAATESILADG
jgi:site-specific recombinase XerD